MGRDDVLVVGSGPNGLTAAVRLQQAGLQVRVLEAQPDVGGAVRSRRSDRGVVHDIGSAVHPMGYVSPAWSAWPLADHGLSWVQPDLPLAHPLDDGRSVFLMGACRGRGQAWRTVVGGLSMDLAAFTGGVLAPVVRVPTHPLWLAGFGAAAVWPSTWTQGAWRDRQERALWAGLAAHANLPLSAPGTSAVALSLAILGERSGWPFPEGGAGALTQALRSYFEALGGTVETGVTVSSWSDVAGHDAVLFNLTVPALLSVLGDALPREARRTFGALKPGQSVVKVDLEVDGGVPWRDARVAQAGTVHLGGEAAAIVAAEAEVARGRVPDRPYVLASQPGRFDPTRNAGTVEPLWAYTHLPRALAASERAVQAAAQATLDQLERYAPGLRERTVSVEVSGPAALEAGNANLAGGDIAGGAPSLMQLVARPRWTRFPYDLPLPGAFLASASTPPGPGVHGMAGFHAAARLAKQRFGLDLA